MRIENEYHGDEDRWYWRVYADGSSQPVTTIVREGSNRSRKEADGASQVAALEYHRRDTRHVKDRAL